MILDTGFSMLDFRYSMLDAWMRRLGRENLALTGMGEEVGNQIRQERTSYPIQAYRPKFDHQASVHFSACLCHPIA